MIIELCMGNFCKEKDSFLLLGVIRQVIKDKNMEDRVEVRGSMCCRKCSEPGVAIKIDGELITGITENNFLQIFDTKIKGFTS